MLALTFVVTALLPVTWIVDSSNGVGTNFTDLPAAVAAAASGDTIIVRGGTYSAFNVSGKALTIRGAGNLLTLINYPAPAGSAFPQTAIDGVQPGQHFYISGVRFTPSFNNTSAFTGLRVLGASTQLVITDSVVIGERAGTALFVSGAEVHVSRTGITVGVGGAPGVTIVAGGKLVADACNIIGGVGLNSSSPTGGQGIFVQNSFATLARCTVQGGFGINAGGNGVEASTNSFVRIAGEAPSYIQGGSTNTVPGGYAAWADASSSIVLHGGVWLRPGIAGGPLTNGPVSTGVALPYLSMTGTTMQAGSLTATASSTLTWDGVIPNAPFATALDIAPGFSTVSGFLGAILVPLSSTIVVQGSLSSNARYQLTLVPAAVAPNLIGVPLYMQFAVLDPSGPLRLSNGLVRVFE